MAVSKLNGAWSPPIIGSIEISVDQNKWWFQIHNEMFDTSYCQNKDCPKVKEYNLHLGLK